MSLKYRQGRSGYIFQESTKLQQELCCLLQFIHAQYKNRFECPYDNNKEEEEEEQEEAKSIDVDQLFQLSEIAFLVELAFATAEKDTSKIQIRNRQDAYNALTDRETFDKLMQKGLDAEHQKYKNKNEIVEFFMNIKDKVRIEDLTFYGQIVRYYQYIPTSRDFCMDDNH